MKKAILLILGLFAVKIISNLKNGQTFMESIMPIKSADDIAKNILKKFEGLASSSAVRTKMLDFQGLYPDHTVLHAYPDSKGVWTIGWGTIHYPGGGAVKKGDTCTLKMAREYFLHEYNMKKAAVLEMVKVPQTPNQIGVLTSLTYNIGRNAFRTSSLLQKLNSGKPKTEVADEFTKWVFSGGNFIQGLLNRRKEEKQIYLS